MTAIREGAAGEDEEKGSGLVVLCFLSRTNSRAAARAERGLKPQTTCRRSNPTCTAQGTAAPQATTHCIQLLLALQYQAASWHQPRRVVAKVEWHQGELFPRVGFIVVNFSKRAYREALVADDATGETRQDRHQGDAALEVRVEARPRDFSGYDSDNGNPEFARRRREKVKRPSNSGRNSVSPRSRAARRSLR